MCGIFGIIIRDRSKQDPKKFLCDLKELYKLSMMRGQDSTGLAINDTESIKVFKRHYKPTEFISEEIFSESILTAFDFNAKPLSVIGHCRLVTDGSLTVENNNQPICSKNIVGIHNGIVINTESLPVNSLRKDNEKKIQAPTMESSIVDSDTCQLIDSISELYAKNDFNLIESLSYIYEIINGTASIALMSNIENNIYLATNNGSLYYYPDGEIFMFASEKIILKKILNRSKLIKLVDIKKLKKLESNKYLSLNQMDMSFFSGDMNKHESDFNVSDKNSSPSKISIIKKNVEDILRCTKCVLPDSYPGIHFNDEGVCNYCVHHSAQKIYGQNALEELLDKYRKNNGDYDCLVGLSGGRDSSYGIHLLKTKYGMNPLAYTYDWGLTTDQARRNIAKMCGQLGIEHIIRAPDIAKKRRHIRKNINAWLNKPEMGMVPLFQAGDKDFYHYGRELRKNYDIDLTIFCAGQLLEQRQFFVGFCGVNENVTNTGRLYDYKLSIKFRLALYYLYQYVVNPRYINESLFDSIRSFFTSFMANDNFLYLYEYLPWDEKEIEYVLKNVYDWQTDVAYGKNQWRMGDGQTAFINYIFHTVAGFSEFDNFRSNQIREGLISRNDAVELITDDNKPKWEALQYFAYVVGINLDEVLAKINNIPKLY